jgi:Spy/CpxP family protein refolding chaperone
MQRLTAALLATAVSFAATAQVAATASTQHGPARRIRVAAEYPVDLGWHRRRV